MRIEKEIERKMKYNEFLALIDQLEKGNIDIYLSYCQADKPLSINYTLYNMGVRVDIFNLKLDIITSVEGSFGFIDINFPKEIESKSSYLRAKIRYIYSYEPDYDKLGIQGLIYCASSNDEDFSNNLRKRNEYVEISFMDDIGETIIKFNCDWKVYDSIINNIERYTEELLLERKKILEYDESGVDVHGFLDSIDNILQPNYNSM